MTSSNAQIDRLLEAGMGPPAAAHDNVIAALRHGFARASHCKALIAYLWVLYVLLVERGGALMLDVLRRSSTFAQATLAAVDGSANGSLFSATALDAGYSAIIADAVYLPLWTPGVFFVLVQGVLAGGIIAYLHAPRPAPLLAQLGAQVGLFAGRFLRLIALAAVLLWALQVAGSTLFSASATGSTLWAQILTAQLAVAFLALVLDYTRVRVVARDSRSMVLETLRSSRFVVHNLPRILALELIFVVIAGLIGGGLLAAVGLLRPAVAGTSLTLVAEQTYVVALLWVRLAAWAAQLSLYQGITARRLAAKAA